MSKYEFVFEQSKAYDSQPASKVYTHQKTVIKKPQQCLVQLFLYVDAPKVSSEDAATFFVSTIYLHHLVFLNSHAKQTALIAQYFLLYSA